MKMSTEHPVISTKQQLSDDAGALLLAVKAEPIEWENGTAADASQSLEDDLVSNEGETVGMEEKTGVASMMVCKQELVPTDPKTEPVDVKFEEESAGTLQSDDSPDDYYNMDEVQAEELSSPEGKSRTEELSPDWENQQATKKSKVILCPHCEYSTSENFLLKSHMRLFHKGKGGNEKLSPKDEDEPNTQQESQIFFCQHCEYSTTETFLLKSHNRLCHKGEGGTKKLSSKVEDESNNQQASQQSKVISCPHCEYIASEKFLLKSHMRLFHKDKESTGDKQSPADIDPESIPISSEEYLTSLIKDQEQSRNNNALTIDAPKSPGSEYIPSSDELDSDEETSESEGASEDELFSFKTKGAKRHNEPAQTQADKYRYTKEPIATGKEGRKYKGFEEHSDSEDEIFPVRTKVAKICYKPASAQANEMINVQQRFGYTKEPIPTNKQGRKYEGFEEDSDSEHEIFPTKIKGAERRYKPAPAQADKIIDLREEFECTKQSISNKEEGSNYTTVIGPDYFGGTNRPDLPEVDRELPAGISCPNCVFTAPDPARLLRHMLHFHKKEASNGALRELEGSVGPIKVVRRHSCIYSHCGYSSNCRHSLNRHLVAVHRDVSGLKKGTSVHMCDLCDYMTLSLTHFTKHVNTHSNLKDFECDMCEFSTKQLRRLTSHKVSVHRDSRIIETTETFKCEQCDFITLEQNRLTAHMLTHTEGKPYNCPRCSYKAAKWNRVVLHMVTVHKDTSQAGRSHVYRCEKCSYMSTHASTFRSHMWTHTGERPYKCEKCEYRTNCSSNLRRHLRVMH